MKHALLGVGCLLLMGLSLQVGAYDEVHLKKLRAVGSCPSCDLSGAFLYNENLEDANLEGTNLTGACLYKANLKGTNLTNANLTTVTLEKSKNFNTAITTGAIFRSTVMPDGSKNKSGC